MNKIMKSRKRRGLSSIVGALFFIILMIGTFTALLAAFSYQKDLVDTQNELAQQNIARVSEKFYVTANETGSGKLWVTVKNQGTNPVEIAKLWVIEKDTPEKKATPYDLSFVNSTIPVSLAKNVTDGSITLDQANHYTVKLVSRLGNIVTVDVPETTFPPGPPGQKGLACWDLNENGVKDYVPSPGPTVPGDEDTNEDFVVDVDDCAGGPPGPAGPPGPKGDSGVVRILEDDLLNKPGIFLTFPSPFGDVKQQDVGKTYKGLWGVSVANPTDVDMEVNKVVIGVMSPRTDPADKLFDASPSANPDCTPVNVRPNSTSLSKWKCDVQNQVVWLNSTTSGTKIPPRSSLAFFARVSPGATSQSVDLDGFPIFASVTTSYGQFGKTGYVSSMRGNVGPIVSVYLSDTMDSVSPTNMFGRTVMTTQTVNTMYVTLADLNGETDVANYIKSQSQLVINLPVNFTLTESDATIQANSPAFTNVKHINNTNNKTVQLVADLDVDVGVTVPEGKTLKFKVNSPTVTSDRLYVMFVLARGTYIPELVGPENAYLGPVSEILIEVKP